MQEKFIKLFIKDLARIYDLTPYPAMLLIFLAGEMRVDNTLIVTRDVKTRAAKSIHVSLGTISNLLTALVKSGVIVREALGVYQVSPFVLAYGNVDYVKSKRKIFMSISYSDEGRVVNVSVE